jgi:two-component sensor histidine kinase/putative methionine-R-sulfoxide reductase with GAF domain
VTLEEINRIQKENAELRAQNKALTDKKQHLEVINLFATSLIEQNTIDEIVWDVAKNAVSKLELIDCIIYLFDEDYMHLVQRAAFGPKNPGGQDIKDPIVVLKGQGIVGSVAVTGVAQKIDNTDQDVRYIVDDEQRLSELAVPIIAKNGKVIGVIDTEHPERNYYTQQHVDVLTTIASITATKIMQADAQNALQKHQDHLEELVRKRTSEIEEVIEELRKSDKEKSVLLKEIHHRVKNNMQVINSLIQLQSMKVEDEEVLALFKVVQDRVIAMALIHVKLYQSNDFANIVIQDYLEELAKNLLYSYQLENSVSIDLDLAVSTMDIDSLIALGLIFNEVLSNSLKHAFIPGKPGKIFIRLKLDEDNEYMLIMGDDGVGMSDDTDWENPTTLGIDLIKTLVDQIDGTIEKVGDVGTAYEIRFRPQASKA